MNGILNMVLLKYMINQGADILGSLIPYRENRQNLQIQRERLKSNDFLFY